MNVVRLLVLGVMRLCGESHGYAVHRELVGWQVETWTSMKAGSIYHALKQLQREGKLEATGTTESAEGPARTLYRLTPAGDAELVALLEEALQSVHLEWFGAGIALMQLLPRDRVLDLLGERLRATTQNRDYLDTLVPSFPNRFDPPHTPDLLHLWSGVLSSTIVTTTDLIARLEAGEYRMAGEATGTR